MEPRHHNKGFLAYSEGIGMALKGFFRTSVTYTL